MYLRLGDLRVSGYNVMLAIAVFAALATLSCWLWVYQALHDRRRLGKGDIRANLSATWNPVAWLIGGGAGLLVAAHVFLTLIWPWSRLHWHEEWTLALFLAACIALGMMAVAVAVLTGALVSFILYPFQVMALAVIHAPDWRDRLLMVLADILILVSGALALLAASQVRLL